MMLYNFEKDEPQRSQSAIYATRSPEERSMILKVDSDDAAWIKNQEDVGRRILTTKPSSQIGEFVYLKAGNVFLPQLTIICRN